MPGIWSRHRDEITIDRLQKFWNELPIQARNNLLRIDKQTLFEQARKNLYCSRCNGLLLESFTQIVMYGKSLQNHEGNLVNSYMDQEDDEVAQDPAVHPWGGLAATKDGLLTLLDCFINARSLNPLQNVFDSARGREREREMLYPDACGGEGRGWISQSGSGTGGYGRGTRETCALHTARLSCDTLMDFWSALGDETRASLLQMKEDDFIERLMYRFDSKRFCRDCRRNVIREFKELKELKRLRREPRCNILFCGADTAFQYEVSDTTVQADWQDFFTEGKYHHFEWGVGTSEGKGDICEFKNIGLISKVSRTDLELSQYTSLFIGLRAWRNDGKCSEYCVKAHAMKGRLCVHRRLVVGDGVVSITKGESMRRFFEHAEEAEEEDEEDAMERDGSDMDGDGAHPQKHAKSPELAREFLLDAATVIFKEQVEKAFREGTARQNAHSVFVSLALKLLEDRIHVACKEIITLEKQTMLLEEEEKEKREEEERKERRRNKEREKKLRRKERLSLKGSKENREKESEQEPEPKSPPHHHDEISELKSPESPKSESPLKFPKITPCATEMDCQNEQDESFIVEQSKSTRRKLKLSCSNDNNSGNNNNKNGTIVKKSNRGCDLSYRSRYEYSQNTCGCGDQQNTYKPRQPYYRSTKYLNNGYASETVQKVPSNSISTVTGTVKKDVSLKQVWEPMDSRKKTVASTSASNNNTSSTDFKAGPTSDKVSNTCRKHEVPLQNGNANHSEVCTNNSKNEESFQNTKNADNNNNNNNNCNGSPVNNCNGSPVNSCNGSPVNNQTGDIDNCSSCLSENDSSSTSISSGPHNDSSSTSDSEDQHSEKSEKTFQKDPPKDSELQSSPQRANVNNPPQSVSKVREITVNSPPPIRIGIVPVPVSTQPVHMSAAYYPNVGLGFHNGAVPVYPFAQTGHYNPYPNHHLGYGVPSLHYNGPAVHPLHYNGPAVQPLPVYKHGVRVGLNSDPIANRRVVLPENPNPVRKSNISMCQQPVRPSSNNNNSHNNIEGNGNCNSVKNGERNGGLQSFSLFHFGGPVASRDHAKLERESNGGVQCERKGEDNVKEYNLFSSSQGSFSFF